MADDSLIEWTDATWNPITGCSVVSAGCKHCYAMKLAGTRMKNEPSRAGLTIDTAAGPVWNGQVRFNEQWLDQPLRWKRPRRIFVCAHGDLFHENVPDAWIDRVFAVMALAPQHTFQVLTKRPERMLSYLQDSGYRAEMIGIDAEAMSGLDRHLPDGSQRWPLPLPNVWLGVSVEHQDAANERIPLLMQTPAAVRWISAEPLLEEIIVFSIDGPLYIPDGMKSPLHWVVVGFESGARARPGHPDWARSLRDQCAAVEVPFLFKQWGEWVHRPLVEDTRSDPPASLCYLPEHKATYAKVGKKAAGRLLDGVLHDGYPTP
jgi:protein gp37